MQPNQQSDWAMALVFSGECSFAHLSIPEDFFADAALKAESITSGSCSDNRNCPAQLALRQAQSGLNPNMALLDCRRSCRGFGEVITSPFAEPVLFPCLLQL